MMRTRLIVVTVLLWSCCAVAEGHPGGGVHHAWPTDPVRALSAQQQAMPPFLTGQPFAEPPSIKSVNKRLKFTMVAKNGTITVGGLAIDSAQRYTPAGSRAGLLGPTLRVNPGD